MGSVYYVDFENVHFEGLVGIERLKSDDKVLIYCREIDVDVIKRKLSKNNASVRCCIVNDYSKNALDFELISDLFNSDFEGVKYIISKDKGFDAAIHRGMRKNNLIFRMTSISNNKLETFFEAYGKGCKEVILQ